jgi:hypothetical protein
MCRKKISISTNEHMNKQHVIENGVLSKFFSTLCVANKNFELKGVAALKRLRNTGLGYQKSVLTLKSFFDAAFQTSKTYYHVICNNIMLHPEHK